MNRSSEFQEPVVLGRDHVMRTFECIYLVISSSENFVLFSSLRRRQLGLWMVGVFIAFSSLFLFPMMFEAFGFSRKVSCGAEIYLSYLRDFVPLLLNFYPTSLVVVLWNYLANCFICRSSFSPFSGLNIVCISVM